MLAGGTGGLGRSLALFLADKGARQIYLISRSRDEAYATKQLLTELRGQGVQASAYNGNLSNFDLLSEAFNRMDQEHPAVRGASQCAMVLLHDTLFEKVTFEQWQTSLGPKVQGSHNLDRLLGSEADFFIMLSSFAGIFGNRTQSDYAVACAFQDALAHERWARGQHAVSIDLSIMKGVGYLAVKGSTGALKQWEEPFGINEAELHALIHAAIVGESSAQLVTGFATGGMVRAAGIERPFYFDDAKLSVLAETRLESEDPAAKSSQQSSSAPHDPARAVAKSQSAEQAQQHISDALCARVAKSLQINVADIDTSRPLHAHGVDWLVAVEIRSWLFATFKANISMLDLNSSVPITVLVQNIYSVCELLPENLRK